MKPKVDIYTVKEVWCTCDFFSDKDELHGILKPFLLRRVKTEVLTDLPTKSEVVLYHGLSGLQKKFYKAILTKDVGKIDWGRFFDVVWIRLLEGER